MRDPAVDLWAVDEVHFQQHGSRCRMWVPPETKDPLCTTTPHGGAWDTLAPCGSAMEDFSIAGRQVASTPRVSGNSSRPCK